jgi:hypothetical protein
MTEFEEEILLVYSAELEWRRRFIYYILWRSKFHECILRSRRMKCLPPVVTSVLVNRRKFNNIRL